MDLERAAEKKIRELGAKPAFKGYYDYPCVLCTSMNQEVVHGIPSAKRMLSEGDIVSIDCGVVLDGYYGDAAITVPVGERFRRSCSKLLEVTGAVAVPGIEAARVGNTLGRCWRGRAASAWKPPASAWCASSWATASEPSCTRIRRFRTTARTDQGLKLREGMVLAIEPMVNAGGPDVRVLEDKWTAVTEDGSAERPLRALRGRHPRRPGDLDGVAITVPDLGLRHFATRNRELRTEND